MVFSSDEFLFAFLPIFFLFYYLTPKSLKNFIIVAFSFMFYIFGAGYGTAIFVATVLSTYFIGIEVGNDNKSRHLYLSVGVALTLIPLIYFKYGNFITRSLFSDALHVTSGMPITNTILPLGISFYTFHAISYLVDVYKKKVAPSHSLRDFTMYMVNFPQLIAGPIVRYVEISQSIGNRPVRTEQIFSGIVRFTLGLSKKLLLADSLGAMADPIFALPGNDLTRSVAWLGIVAYTLQIYYDFSGYSDMAIGLGRMMGFEFPENFNQPYRSRSVTEFWRRWHMTLSRWFRDYVYIPLGGNRGGSIRTYLNLVAVFFLCGLWHGAAYSFVVWGLYHGLLLTIERLFRSDGHQAVAAGSGQILTLLLVMIGWVFFRAPSLIGAIGYLASMFSLHENAKPIFGLEFYLTNDKLLALLAGGFFALFPFEKLRHVSIWPPLATGSQIAAVVGLLVYSSAVVATNGFNPFIYFRF